MNKHIADRIAARLQRDGWAEVFGRRVTAADVQEAWKAGTHEFESFASAVLQEAEEYGVGPPG